MPDPREGAEFFLNVPAKLDDPYADLAWLRANRPVFFYPPLSTWYVFRYEDVSALFADPRLKANRMLGLVDAAPASCRDELRRFVPTLESFMLMKDGQDHTRVRSAFQHEFNPEVVKRLAPRIEAAAEELLAPLVPKGELDAAAGYAFLLPAYVLSDLFGVPAEDRGKIVEWSVNFIDFFNIVPITEDTTRRLLASGGGLMEYTQRLLAERRAKPKDDLLGALAERQGQTHLSDQEIAGNVMLLLLAGHVAVRNLIGNCLWLLLTHPEQFAKLKAEPSLLPNAIEETLRFEAPVALIPRVVAEGFTLRGQTLKPDQMVQLSIASANRDEAHFPHADRFDISRTPGAHVAFGHGPHGCLGAALAREIAHIALATLLKRMPNPKLDESKKIVWYRNAANRGPINLWIKGEPGEPAA